MYPVSTASYGVGCNAGSNKTPSGKLRIAEKIGHGCAVGTVFKGRIPTGEIWTEQGGPAGADLILTRILWLEGCEPSNANTKERYIYLHGTNHEQLLGTPCSHGCIRLSNKDILEVFDLVPEGTEVEIIEI